MAPKALVPLEKLDAAAEWQPWKPDANQPFDLKWAGHLFRRAAFGANLAELRLAVKDGPTKTLDRLLEGDPAAGRRLETIEKTGELIARRNNPDELRGWWLYAMLHSLHPLREKLTLFWHDHFATSINKVTEARLMFRQNQTMRSHALARFEPFLQKMSKDPAMLIWLDAASNVKGKPNENYAREVMELFSLGVGNYTETDIRQAARAFTGWQTEEGEFVLAKGLHDDGDKTFLGKTGRWTGEDIVKICTERPACPMFIARKLYRFYVSEARTPPNSFLQPLADAFRKSDLDIKTLVRTMLASRHFFSEHAYRQKIKCPVELTVGALWSVTDREVPQSALLGRLEEMGQTLFAPPNVKGWPGGQAWLNTSTVLARQNYASTVAMGTLQERSFRRRGRFGDIEAEREEAIRAEEDARRAEAEARAKAEGKPIPKPAPQPPPPPPPEKLDIATLVRREKASKPEAIVTVLADVLLQGDIAPAAREKLIAFIKEGSPKKEDADRRIRETAHLLMTLPEYQLN